MYINYLDKKYFEEMYLNFLLFKKCVVSVILKLNCTYISS